jgi:hypothetical protein
VGKGLFRFSRLNMQLGRVLEFPLLLNHVPQIHIHGICFPFNLIRNQGQLRLDLDALDARGINSVRQAHARQNLTLLAAVQRLDGNKLCRGQIITSPNIGIIIVWQCTSIRVERAQLMTQKANIGGTSRKLGVGGATSKHLAFMAGILDTAEINALARDDAVTSILSVFSVTSRLSTFSAFARGALFTLLAHSALFTLDTLGALVSLFALVPTGTLVALWAYVTFFTLDPLGTLVALFALVPLGTFGTLVTLGTLVALFALFSVTAGGNAQTETIDGQFHQRNTGQDDGNVTTGGFLRRP